MCWVTPSSLSAAASRSVAEVTAEFQRAGETGQRSRGVSGQALDDAQADQGARLGSPVIALAGGIERGTVQDKGLVPVSLAA